MAWYTAWAILLGLSLARTWSSMTISTKCLARSSLQSSSPSTAINYVYYVKH